MAFSFLWAGSLRGVSRACRLGWVGTAGGRRLERTPTADRRRGRRRREDAEAERLARPGAQGGTQRAARTDDRAQPAVARPMRRLAQPEPPRTQPHEPAPTETNAEGEGESEAAGPPRRGPQDTEGPPAVPEPEQGIRHSERGWFDALFGFGGGARTSARPAAWGAGHWACHRRRAGGEAGGARAAGGSGAWAKSGALRGLVNGRCEAAVE